MLTYSYSLKMSPAINPTPHLRNTGILKLKISILEQVDTHKLGYYLLTEPVHDLTGFVMKKINKVQPMVPNHE